MTILSFVLFPIYYCRANCLILPFFSHRVKFQVCADIFWH